MDGTPHRFSIDLEDCAKVAELLIGGGFDGLAAVVERAIYRPHAFPPGPPATTVVMTRDEAEARFLRSLPQAREIPWG